MEKINQIYGYIKVKQKELEKRIAFHKEHKQEWQQFGYEEQLKAFTEVSEKIELLTEKDSNES